MINSLSRRKFLLMGAALGAGLCSYSGFDSCDLRIERLEIKFKDLPPHFDGYRLAFISDLHVGPCSSIDLTREAIRLLEPEAPSLLVLGGDYILMPDRRIEQSLRTFMNRRPCFSCGKDYHADRKVAEETYKLIAEVVGDLHPPDGAVAVFGNHDYFVAPGECRAQFERKGVRFLVNGSASVTRDGQRLLIYGCDDFWSGTPLVPAFPSFRPSGDFRLLVSHNPDFLSRLIRRGKKLFELGLCGHTHGGQFKFPLLGAFHYNVEDSRLAEGLFNCDYGKVYTSRGIGTVGLPFRFNCPPEVSLLTLRKG